MAATLSGELRTYEKAVQVARGVAKYRRGRYRFVVGPAIIDTLLPYAPKARTVGRLLTADAVMQAHDGDIDGALDSCRAIIAAGRSIGDDPFLICQIVRMSIVEVGLRTTLRVLGQGEPSDAALARLQSAIRDELDQPLLLYGVKGERAGMDEMIRRIGAGVIPVSALSDERRSRRQESPEAASVSPWGRLWFDAQRGVGLRWMNEAVAIARRPAGERRALWTAWEAKIERLVRDPLGPYVTTLPLLTTPHISSAAVAFSRYQTELGTHLLLLAAERHRRKTGAWPSDVAGIDRGILPSAPVDEFSGGPFRMDYREGELVVYSIGPNGIDEGGAYNPRMWSYGGPDDAGARAWDVSLRRATPVPEEQ